MIDLSKLTPAPWVVDDSRDGSSSYVNAIDGSVEPGCAILSISDCYAPEGETNDIDKWPMPVVAIRFEPDRFCEEPTDLAFIALARNDLDVRQRRGWHTERDPCGTGKWYVPQLIRIICDMDDEDLAKSAIEAAYQHGHDVGLLTRADAWMRENIDGKEQA